MHADSPHLDGQYAAFGYVTGGMDVVDAICAIPTDYTDRPRQPVVIKKITVANEDFSAPETLSK